MTIPKLCPAVYGPVSKRDVVSSVFLFRRGRVNLLSKKSFKNTFVNFFFWSSQGKLKLLKGSDH